MLKQIQSTSEKLIAADIKPADRIAILSQNSPQCVSLILSIWKIGAVAVPLSTRLPIDKLNSILNDASCKYIFVSKNYRSLDIEIQKLNIEDFTDSHKSPLEDLKVSATVADARTFFCTDTVFNSFPSVRRID